MDGYDYGMGTAWDFGPGNIGDSSSKNVFDLVTAGAGFLGETAKTYLAFQQQSNALDLARVQSDTQAKIATLQAQAQLANAQRQALNTANGYGYPNLDQSLANMGTILSNQGGASNLMLWLTVAGVAIAVLQFMKKKG